MKNSQVEATAMSTAELLSYGQVHRVRCPACLGGSSGELTLDIGREPDRVWWKCHRASCAAVGVSGGHALPPGKELDRRLERIRPYRRPVRPCREVDIEYFEQRFEIDIRLSSYVRLTEDLTYIFPYRDALGRKRGYVERRQGWSGWPAYPHAECAGPKTMTYPHTTDPVQGWYRPWEDPAGLEAVVIVEDPVSAIKVAQTGLTAVALLGTGFNAEKVRDIARQRPRVVTLALDPDAQGTAQQMARKWGMYFERCRVVALEADPKDIPKDDLREELGIV